MAITPLLIARSSAKSNFKRAQLEDGGATRAKVKAKEKASVLRGKTRLTPQLPTTKGEKGKENNITLEPVNPRLPAPAVIAA